MSRIKITGIAPDGFGLQPLSVRQAWVGLELPVLGNGNSDCQSFKGPIYRVDPHIALQALTRNDRTEAYEWFRKHLNIRYISELHFPADICEVVDPSSRR